MKKRNMDIQKIIAKLVNDTASVEELEILESWKKESDENLAELNKIIELQKAASDMKDYHSYDVDSAWNKINDRIEDLSEGKDKVRTLIPAWVKGVAASLILAFSAYYFLSQENQQPTEFVSTTSQESISLPDGSEVVLDKGSKINIGEDFVNNRSLSLEGRAYFSVVHMDDSNPFNVSIPNAKITVLGTEFSVFSDGETGQVSVESGRVEVTDENKRVQLRPGDLLLIEDNSFINVENRSSNYFSWTTSKITFDDTPVTKILDELSWIYNTSIDTGKVKIMPTCRVTTSYNNMSISEILDELKEQIGLDYIYKDDIIVVNDVNCT